MTSRFSESETGIRSLEARPPTPSAQPEFPPLPPAQVTDNGDSAVQTVAAILADDLTGACDAAVHFAARGLRTQVAIGPKAGAALPAQAAAWNTDTRCSAPSEAAERVSAMLPLLAARRPRLLLKKIDSMMRGPIEPEIAAMLGGLQLPMAVVAPAFPGAGRIVRNGRIIPADGSAPIPIAEALPHLRCVWVARSEIGSLPRRIAATSRDGATALIVDAEDDDDLRSLAKMQQDSPPVLWVGSGGLALAFAGEFAGDLRAAPPPRPSGPILFCVGSSHPATAAQLEQLLSCPDMTRACADASGLAVVRRALLQGRNAVLLFSRGRIDSEPDPLLADKAGVQFCAGMVATGGDTAQYWLRSLGAQTITLRAEIQPGIPWGEITGGTADGKWLVTKSGAFGDGAALLTCLNFLNPSAGSGQKAKTE